MDLGSLHYKNLPFWLAWALLSGVGGAGFMVGPCLSTAVFLAFLWGNWAEHTAFLWIYLDRFLKLWLVFLKFSGLFLQYRDFQTLIFLMSTDNSAVSTGSVVQRRSYGVDFLKWNASLCSAVHSAAAERRETPRPSILNNCVSTLCYPGNFTFYLPHGDFSVPA